MEGLHFFQLFNPKHKTCSFHIVVHYLLPCTVHRQFRNIDDDGSKSLDYEEFKKGLQDFGLTFADDVSLCCGLSILVTMSPLPCYLYQNDVYCTFAFQEIKALFSRFDKDGNGTLSFDEFLEALRVSN